MKTFFIFTLEVFLYHSRVHTISNSIFKDTYLSSPCPPHRFLCSFVSLSTQHFTVHLLPPYGWASSYLTSPILVLSSSSLPHCGAINIFLHCKPSPYTLSDGGVFFLMACPLLDHTRSPWGVPSKKTEWMFIWSDISCFCTSRRWTEINCNLFRTDTICIHLNWYWVSEMVYVIPYCLQR